MNEPIPSNGEATLEQLAKVSQNMSFDEYQRFFDGHANYMTSKDPQRIIRSGLIEETGEVLETDPADVPELSKEIGDIVFYLNAGAKLMGLNVAEVMSRYGVYSLRDIQTHKPDSRSILILTPSGERLDNQVGVNEQLIVDLLRVVDTLNPKTDELWSHLPVRPEPDTVISEAFFSLGKFAELYDIKLNESVKLSLKKIYTRARNPHVIDQDSNGQMAGSLRERITLDPAVNRMRIATVVNNADAFAINGE